VIGEVSSQVYGVQREEHCRDCQQGSTKNTVISVHISDFNGSSWQSTQRFPEVPSWRQLFGVMCGNQHCPILQQRSNIPTRRR
jgi:hypothetical protein